jgi:mycothiol synthase
MRRGRPEDVFAVRELAAVEVGLGLRDSVPTLEHLQGALADLDWSTRVRVIEAGDAPRGVGLVTVRTASVGTIARIEAVARDESARLDLVRWGLLLSRAAGADVAQVWRARGHGSGLRALGLELARPFWRMDLPRIAPAGAARLPRGYRLALGLDWRLTADAYNRAFAEHWRHDPVDLGRLPPWTRPPDLDLAALAADGSVAGIVWCAVERHEMDGRAQPVGIVQVVGTVPEHRRRGLGSALLIEGLRRLRERGARSASLYVDPLNPTRAVDVYRRLGFRVGFELEVYEASWGQPPPG